MIKLLKILKWDKTQYIHMMINEENLKYARTMIGATCISLVPAIDTTKVIDSFEESITFNELIDIISGLNMEKPYTDGAAIELAIAFCTGYNKNISNIRGNFNNANKLNLVEYIDVIESVSPKKYNPNELASMSIENVKPKTQ